MLVKSILVTCFATLAVAQPYPVNVLYQFPPTPYVNLENLAVRPNGNLAINSVTGPTMYNYDPDTGAAPVRLITLSGPGSLTGIAETSHDVYTVAAGNFSFGPSVPGGVAGIAGTFSVWNIDLNGAQAAASQVVAIPEAVSLNGITKIPGVKDTVLIADSGLGAIWAVNVKTGAYQTALASPLFAPTPAFSLGINGIHFYGKDLYFTNSAQGTFGKVEYSKRGFGEPVVVANAANGTAFDDFAFDKNGNAWIATQENSVSIVSMDGSVQVAAGGGEDQTLVSPTSVVFRGNQLFGVTGGLGAPPPRGVSGQIFRIDTPSSGSWRKWTA